MCVFIVSPTFRWRSLGGPAWSRNLGSKSGSPSALTVGAEPSGEGPIEAPKLTATATATAVATAEPVATRFSWERSSDGDGDGDGDGREDDFLAGKAINRGGTAVQRASNEVSRLAAKQRLHPLFPPMPPIPPAPRPRKLDRSTPPSVPAAAWGELEQDSSVCEGVPLSLLPNHCSTALIDTTAHGSLLSPNHRSEEEGEQLQNDNWRPAGEVLDQDDLAVSRGYLGNILVPPPFLPPLKEKAEAEEQEQQEQEQQEQHYEQENAMAESTDWSRDGVGMRGHGRETSIVVRMVADVVPLDEAAMNTGGARIPSFAEEAVAINERVPARSDQQQLEEEREEGLMGHRAQRHRALRIAGREKEADASSLVPRATSNDTARKNQLELGDVEDDDGARGEGHGEQRHTSCSRADNGEAVDRFCERDGDTVLQSGQVADGANSRDEAQGTVAEREESEEESDSSYRRDCAVLAGTAKIVFALLALEHRGVSSRFYRWKRTRDRPPKDRQQHHREGDDWGKPSARQEGGY